MKSNTSAANCGNLPKTEKLPWFSPPDRPWLEFIVVVALLCLCATSMIKLIVDANYATVEVRVFHERLNRSMKVRDALLKQISIQVGVPANEVDKILSDEPVY